MDLIKVKEIEPLPNTLCLETKEIVGVGGSADGGISVYGSLASIISENKSTKRRFIKIACRKSNVLTLNHI